MIVLLLSTVVGSFFYLLQYLVQFLWDYFPFGAWLIETLFILFSETSLGLLLALPLLPLQILLIPSSIVAAIIIWSYITLAFYFAQRSVAA